MSRKRPLDQRNPERPSGNGALSSMNSSTSSSSSSSRNEYLAGSSNVRKPAPSAITVRTSNGSSTTSHPTGSSSSKQPRPTSPSDESDDEIQILEPPPKRKRTAERTAPSLAPHHSALKSKDPTSNSHAAHQRAPQFSVAPPLPPNVIMAIKEEERDPPLKRGSLPPTRNLSSSNERDSPSERGQQNVPLQQLGSSLKQEQRDPTLNQRGPPLKQEYRSPSPFTKPQPFPVNSGTKRFHPLPYNCTQAHPDYKRNRSYWAREQWMDVLTRSPGLKNGNMVIRDDGLAIDWTSDVPVWSDTLVPVHLDPRDGIDEEEDTDGDEDEDDDEIQEIAPPPKKPDPPRKPPIEVIDVDALSSDEEQQEEAEDEDEEEEQELAHRQDDDEDGLYADDDYEDESEDEDDIDEDAETDLEEERDVEGLREPPPSPAHGGFGDDDALAGPSMAVQDPPRSALDMCQTTDPLFKLRARRRQEMQQLMEEFLTRYIQTFERDRESLSDAYAPYAQFSIRTHIRNASSIPRVSRYCPSPATPAPDSSHILRAADIPRATGRANIMQAFARLGPHTFFPHGKTFDIDYDHVFLANVDGTGDVLLSFYGEVVLVSGGSEPDECLSVDQTMLLRNVDDAEEEEHDWPMVIVSHQMIVKDVPWRRVTNMSLVQAADAV